MKILRAVLLIMLLSIMASAPLPSNGGLRSAHAGHTGMGGAWCPCNFVNGQCPCCGLGGLTHRDQGEDGEAKVTEPIDTGWLSLAVRLFLLRRF